METGSVVTAPASNTDHTLSDTLQKALEALKSHQKWISNRANPVTVAPEQLDDARVPKTDLWMMQEEDLVDKRTTHFPVRKLKLGGFKSAAVGGKKIFPTSAIKPMNANEQLNKSLHPPKAAFTAWDELNPTSKETKLIAVDLEEEDTTVAADEGNNSGIQQATFRRKEQERVINVDTRAQDDDDDDDDGISTTRDEDEQASAHLEEPVAIEQLAEDVTDKDATSSSELLHNKDNSFAPVETSLPSNGVIPLSDAQEILDKSVGEFDGHVLAVSPAPKSQQLSLSSVTQSKLRMSELEAFRLENNTAVAAGSRRETSAGDVIVHSVQKLGDTKKSDVSVPDSVLHVVIPQQKKETHAQAAVFTLPRESTILASSSVQTSEKEKAVEGDTSVNDNSRNSRKNIDNSIVDSSTVSVAKVLDLPELKDPNELVKKLPTITDKKYSIHTTVTDDDKRSHSPPPFVLHKKYAILPPPCPVYGIRQPTVLPVKNASVKRPATSSTPRDSPAPLVKEPASVLSVKPISSPTSDVECCDDMHSTLSSTILTAAPATADSRCLSMEDEVDSSLQSLSLNNNNNNNNNNGVQSASQYFVSSSGNQPLSELPKLHQAASVGNIHKIQHLLNHGVNVNQTDFEGRTAIMHCIHPKCIHLASADLLIKEGANLNHQCSDGYTVLHLAAYQGAISLVQLLLLNGAQVDIRDKDGRLPLHWATHPASTKCISTILKNSLYGVDDVDKANMTCLMWACYHNRVNVAAFLLDKHADKEEKDVDGMTAMHWAIHSDDVSCLKLLLTPDTTYFKDKMGRTVMHTAAEKGSLKACEVILNLRLDAVYDTDKKGRTPLHWAAVNNNVDTCDLLLDRGADASQCDSLGKSSLDYARIKGYDHVVAMLTSHETSRADFARTSRSVSLSTLRSRVPSFGELPRSPLMRALSHDADDNGQEDNISIISKESEEGDCLLVERGCYLGLFTKYGKGPVEHHFFKLDKKEKVLLRSREEDINPKYIEKLKILSVQPSPSLTVRSRLDYSPLDLHKYAFCIITTHTGPMDVLAYTDRAYTGWIRELTKLCNQQEAAVDNRNHFLSTRNCTEMDDDDCSAISVPASSPGWTDNSLVHKQLQQTPKQIPNSHFFTTSTPQNDGSRQSWHKPNGRLAIPEETDTTCNGSTIISNPALFTSTPHRSQPDHLPYSIMNSNDDDIV